MEKPQNTELYAINMRKKKLKEQKYAIKWKTERDNWPLFAIQANV